MRVSKLFVWIIAVFAALIFAFTPVVLAGEHPWNEDESASGTGDGGEPDNGGTDPDDPNVIDPGTIDNITGSSLFWWGLIWDGILTSQGNDNAPAESVSAAPVNNQRGERASQ